MDEKDLKKENLYFSHFIIQLEKSNHFNHENSMASNILKEIIALIPSIGLFWIPFDEK